MGDRVPTTFNTKEHILNNLEQTTEHQKNLIESLKTEIKLLRKEIAGLREERRILFDRDKPPGYEKFDI